jgi:hypothetical protein
MSQKHRGNAKRSEQTVKKRQSFFLLFFLMCTFCNSPMQSSATAIGSLTFDGVFPRIFTPNGDGYNDKAVFHFTNPELLPVAGKVFDISGSEVGSLTPSTSSPTEQLLWDGKDSGGRTVPGGIYVYRIDFEGENITGTVVVAR